MRTPLLKQPLGVSDRHRAVPLADRRDPSQVRRYLGGGDAAHSHYACKELVRQSKFAAVASSRRESGPGSMLLAAAGGRDL